MSSTLYVITYDEGGFSSGTENRIYTLFIGAGVRPGSSTETCINHYGILGTLESIFETGNLGRKDVGANQVSGVWL
jgi:hypothetical protein